MQAIDAARDGIGTHLAGDARSEARAGHEALRDADWKEAHQKLLTLATERAGLDFEEGRWLLSAFRWDAHRRLGYGAFTEYVARLFGYGAHFTKEKLRVAEALEELPVTTEALRTGEVSFSAVRELTRVAIPSTEQAWLQAARGKTVREVERLISGQRVGSRPGDAPDSSIQLHKLRFEVSGEVFATFREAVAKLQRDAGEPLDDDAVLLLLARLALGGPRDEGRANYQVALTICEQCRRGWQQGRGEQVEVSQAALEMAECDAQHIGPVGVGDVSHVGATPGPVRATQTIPPAVRRKVSRRDGGRCRVPGCRHATYVDVHHRKPRSEQGGHQPDNLITLCSAHHLALHDGALVLRAGRIAAAGCVLPLAEGSLPPPAGLRHRAALGLAEQTDAVVVVVSEETGHVSVARDAALEPVADIEALRSLLRSLLEKQP